MICSNSIFLFVLMLSFWFKYSSINLRIWNAFGACFLFLEPKSFTGNKARIKSTYGFVRNSNSVTATSTLRAGSDSCKIFSIISGNSASIAFVCVYENITAATYLTAASTSCTLSTREAL